MEVQAGEGSGRWAGFERDEWLKERLLAKLRGKEAVRKTLDFSSCTRTGQLNSGPVSLEEKHQLGAACHGRPVDWLSHFSLSCRV